MQLSLYPSATQETPSIDQPGITDAYVLSQFAKDAFGKYAVSSVKGRALPDITDGLKPVQRRILFAMHELKMSFGSAFKKSARVVGDVIGKYHPHGDTAAYDALTRMAQDFTLRYPLIDGQGNFGSRDGDNAAAMRYTEARLSKYAELLLSELDMGTVDFIDNYDGNEKEPADLPSRLPFLLLNGASGIAVGMATECPPHNMREVGRAAIHILRDINSNLDTVMHEIKGPDFSGGGQIINSPDEIKAIYESGRGSLKVRGRWEFERQKGGDWRMVVFELPQNVSVKMILEELGEMVDPKLKEGKKDLTPDQKNMRQLCLDLISTARDDSDKDNQTRIILEPRHSRIDQERFLAFLLKYTSLEVSVPVNLTAISLSGRPEQKNLYSILKEWTEFRTHVVTRRSKFRLDQVQKRLHLFEGRMIAFLHIDEVIKVIRNSDDPESDLIAKFNLSEVQAKDILEIRLRQLARLEGFKLENEMKELREEENGLKNILGSPSAMHDLIISEIEADMKKFGDDRRTLIEEVEKTLVKVETVPDEPCVIILSKNGWIRQRTGYDTDTSTLSFKEGDSLLTIQKTRSIHPIVVIDSEGRAYTISAKDIPGGRSDGVPVTSLVDIQNKNKVVGMCTGPLDTKFLLSTTNGFGFIATLKDFVSKQRAGKTFMKIEGGQPLPPVEVGTGTMVASLGSNGKLLCFPIEQVRELPGGKGVTIMGLGEHESLISVGVLSKGQNLHLFGGGRGGKKHEALLKAGILEGLLSQRARKGVIPPVKFTPTTLKPEVKG